MREQASSRLVFNRRTIISNIAALFAGSVVSQGLTSLALLITARQLGASLYGEYASYFVLLSFTSILFNLGLDIWLLREGSRQLGELSELIGSVLVVKLVLGTLWFGLVSLLGPSLWDMLNIDRLAPELLRVSAIAVWMDCAMASLLTTYKARLANTMTSIIQGGTRGAWFIGTLVLLSLGNRDVGAYIQLRAAVAGAAFVITAILIGLGIGYRVSFNRILEVITAAPAFASSEFLAWAYMRIDTLIITVTLGKQALGLYSPAVGIVNALFLVPATLYGVVLPVLSSLFETNREQAWLTARRMLLVLAAIGVTLTLAVGWGSPMVDKLLGESYSGTSGVLAILSVILFFHSLSYGMAAILVANNQQPQRVVVQMITVALSVLLNIIAVRTSGIRGVSYIYVITEVVLLLGYSWLAYSRRLRKLIVTANR